MPLQNVYCCPWCNIESREYETIDFKNKPHGYIQVKVNAVYRNTIKRVLKLADTLFPVLNASWIPLALVVHDSSFWGLLKSLLFRKCSPESFCVELMASLSLKAVCPWPVFPWHNILKCYSIYHVRLLRFESCYCLFFNHWNISIWPICIVYILQKFLEPWDVVYNYWNSTYVYFCTTII